MRVPLIRPQISFKGNSNFSGVGNQTNLPKRKDKKEEIYYPDEKNCKEPENNKVENKEEKFKEQKVEEKKRLVLRPHDCIGDGRIRW